MQANTSGGFWFLRVIFDFILLWIFSHLIECVDKQLDIYIVVDKSKSIKDHELVKARRCVKYVLNNFDVAKNKTRIGLVSYHKYAITEFDLDAYSTIQEMNALTLVSRPVKVAGTKTAKALSLMLENFKAEAKPGREKIGILVTDGKATEPVKDIAAEIEKTDVKVSFNAILDIYV